MEDIKSNKNKKEEDNTENSEGLAELNKLISYSKQDSELTTIINIDEELSKNFATYQKLIFSNNKLTNIKEFFIFTNIIYLDLSNNLFTKLTNLSPLKNIEILIISNNKLTNISKSLSDLKKLQYLDLSNNLINIKSTALITMLKYNIGLVSLILFGNQNYDFNETKFLCLDQLKNLNYLDAVRIVGNCNRDKNIKNKKTPKTSINVKGIKGNKKNISTLEEYVKFKINDFDLNKKDYEKEIEKNKINENNVENNLNKIKKNSSSYYYIKYLSSSQNNYNK